MLKHDVVKDALILVYRELGFVPSYVTTKFLSCLGKTFTLLKCLHFYISRKNKGVGLGKMKDLPHYSTLQCEAESIPIHHFQND